MAQKAQARTEFSAALNQVCAERGIEPEVVIETIKSAILAAFRKDYPDTYEQAEESEDIDLDVDIDPIAGGTKVYQIKNGNKTDITPPGFGRIAAQTAKQVILQRVREAEKDAIIAEYQDKVGTMITGMVLRFDGKNVIFDIGRGQGYMPPEEQIRGEFYKINQRMAVYIEDIRETMRGRTIIVSRSTDKLVYELFAREVPEVNSGAVEIKAIAREAGIRTKIAVDSNQSGVDPVGSCVGQKGVRVQEIINELNNEKIDIIQYSDDPDTFIKAALAPADGLELDIDTDKQYVLVTVPDDQLSLAIGKGGQNVRLAAKLTGYKIDIKGASGETISVSLSQDTPLEELELTTRTQNALKEAGITNLSELREAQDRLGEIKGIGPKSVEEITDLINKTEKRADASDQSKTTKDASEEE